MAQVLWGGSEDRLPVPTWYGTAWVAIPTLFLVESPNPVLLVLWEPSHAIPDLVRYAIPELVVLKADQLVP